MDLNLKNKQLELQIATQCAPLLAGLKPSNLLILPKYEACDLKKALKNTRFSFYRLSEQDGREVYLLYQVSELVCYLTESKVQDLLRELGYKELQLCHLLETVGRKYKNHQIYGTKFPYIPDTGDVPLVADLSSCILSEPVDVSKFGVIYAGAQKNMAPAGLTVVIIREDLLGKARKETPTMLDYKVMADNGSMYNTPPCYCIYVAKLVYEWILSLGGLQAMKERNEKKAALLYGYLDGQTYYKAPVSKESRSMMNVTFVTGDADLDKKFCAEAANAGLVNLKGHRSVGGMRASIYNAMPYEGVEKLVQFMADFAAKNPKNG